MSCIGKRILLYSLSTFPIKGSVRATQRVSTDFAEGQYALSAGSVPTAFPTAFLNEQPYLRSHCLCVNMTFSAKGIRSLIMPYHEVPESQMCSAYSRYPYNLEPAHNFLAVSPKAHFCQTGARPAKKKSPCRTTWQCLYDGR